MLAQDFKDFELLIVDDCSTDGTAEIVRPFCARDPRIRFLGNPKNLGMVNNWNRCLEEARGKYAKFLFGDDRLCHPQALGKLAALLERHPSATLASSARVILDEESKVADVYRDLSEGCHPGRNVIEACLMANGKNLVGEPSAVLFRKADAQRGFDPLQAEQPGARQRHGRRDGHANRATPAAVSLGRSTRFSSPAGPSSRNSRERPCSPSCAICAASREKHRMPTARKCWNGSTAWQPAGAQDGNGFIGCIA